MAKNHLFQLTIYVVSIVLSRAQAVTDDRDTILFKNEPILHDGHLLQDNFETAKYNPFEKADNDDYNRLSHLPDYMVYKRVPTGFMGMRGKKDWEYTDLNRFGLRNQLNDNNGFSYYGRSPYTLDDKRAPNGFMGMRGKKASSKFYGVRGKKNQYNDNEVMQNDEMDKLNLFRNMGYDIYDENYPWINEYNENRLVRSSLKNMDGNDCYFNSNYFPKRTNNRFYATRGKKDQSGLVNDILESRSKKFWKSPSFFESRGKKQPSIGFRNKFVGVRGKKSSDGSLQKLETQLIGTLTGSQYNDNIETNKRVPNGFVGMRGKKDELNLSNSI